MWSPFLKFLQLINVSVLNMINLSLIIIYGPQAFKSEVVQLLLKKPSLTPAALASYRPLTLTFLSCQKFFTHVDACSTIQVGKFQMFDSVHLDVAISVGETSK